MQIVCKRALDFTSARSYTQSAGYAEHPSIPLFRGLPPPLSRFLFYFLKSMSEPLKERDLFASLLRSHSLRNPVSELSREIGTETETGAPCLKERARGEPRRGRAKVLL